MDKIKITKPEILERMSVLQRALDTLSYEWDQLCMEEGSEIYDEELYPVEYDINDIDKDREVLYASDFLLKGE